MININLFLLLG